VPIYVYECSSCGERFEYTQSLSEPKKTICEKCGGALEKVIAPTAFHLKGGGWYKDLYSSSKSGGSSGSSSGSASGSSGESKSEAKTESKAESKSESKPSGSGGST
jgi:putative FmdB family regulatory protein